MEMALWVWLPPGGGQRSSELSYQSLGRCRHKGWRRRPQDPGLLHSGSSRVERWLSSRTPGPPWWPGRGRREEWPRWGWWRPGLGAWRKVLELRHIDLVRDEYLNYWLLSLVQPLQSSSRCLALLYLSLRCRLLSSMGEAWTLNVGPLPLVSPGCPLQINNLAQTEMQFAILPPPSGDSLLLFHEIESGEEMKSIQLKGRRCFRKI